MSTGLYQHPACLAHDTGDGHPESAARLVAITTALKQAALPHLDWREAPEVTDDQLERLHPREHVEAVLEALAAIPPGHYRRFGEDTVASSGTAAAARRAAGGPCAAVDAVMAGEIANAFCALRPPGHHAEPREVMGFCFFSNVALAAAHARHHHGLARVAVVDFDVHHGNGTQACLQHDPGCLFISTHQSPLYPGTGRKTETGVDHNVLNLPLAPHSGSAEIRHAFSQHIAPALTAFRPELLLISAGFDAHYLDPLANLDFHEADYVWLTKKLLEIARDSAQGRVVSVLEGGYHLSALGASVVAHVRELHDAGA